MTDEIPRIKKGVLTQKLAVSVDEMTKSDYDMLKARYRIDVAECVRRAVRAEIERLKVQVSKSA